MYINHTVRSLRHLKYCQDSIMMVFSLTAYDVHLKTVVAYPWSVNSRCHVFSHHVNTYVLYLLMIAVA